MSTHRPRLPVLALVLAPVLALARAVTPRMQASSMQAEGRKSLVVALSYSFEWTHREGAHGALIAASQANWRTRLMDDTNLTARADQKVGPCSLHLFVSSTMSLDSIFNNPE